MLADCVGCEMVRVRGLSQVERERLGIRVDVFVLWEESHVFFDFLELLPFFVGRLDVDRPESDFDTRSVELIDVFECFKCCCPCRLVFGHW